MKNTQSHQVIKILLETGEVSRNQCLGLYITRLSAIILELTKNGWVFSSKFVKKGKSKDYVYKVLESPFKKEYFKVESTGEIIEKLVRK